MGCAQQTRFLVHVRHWTEIAANDLKVCVLPNIVLGHFKHPEVEISYGTEGSTCDQDDGGLVWISEHRGKTVMRKGVIWGVVERALGGILLVQHRGGRRTV